METKGCVVDHPAIVVADIGWYIRFFSDALGMEVCQTRGPADHPESVWLTGGVQLLERPGFDGAAGRLDHLALRCEDLAESIRRVGAYAAGRCEQGDNWLRLPDGLVLELMQAE